MISSINCNGVKTHDFEILEINGLSPQKMIVSETNPKWDG